MKKLVLSVVLSAMSLVAMADLDGKAGEKEAQVFVAANPQVFVATVPTTFITYTGCQGYLDCK